MYSSFAQTYLAEISSELKDIDQDLTCDTISNIWNSKIIDKGICSNSISGLFIMWIAHIFVASSLTVTIILASLLYQYFESEYWNLSKDTIVGDEGIIIIIIIILLLLLLLLLLSLLLLLLLLLGINDDNVHEIALAILSSEKYHNEEMKKIKSSQINQIYGKTDDI